MNILFLFPYPLQQAPSQRFRFEQYFEALIHQGHSINSQSFWGDYYWQLLYGKGNAIQKLIGLTKGFWRRLKILSSAGDADVIFIHRELTPVGPPLFEWIIARVLRKRVIFDFDDAIWLPNTSETNKVAAFLKWHSKTASICSWAWKVSAGNEFLAAYARQFNSRVVVNPTTIDTENYHLPSVDGQTKSDNRLVIGWTGSHSTLAYLDMLWPVLEKLQHRHAFTFAVIADRPPTASYPWLKFVHWNKDSEIADLSTFDIGVMPLRDDQWSRGKCGFKALQYLALSIPAVASPVGVNTQIVKTGVNGFLCETENEWLQALENLLVNDDLRKSLGKQGRETVDAAYSVRANTANFLALFAN